MPIDGSESHDMDVDDCAVGTESNAIDVDAMDVDDCINARRLTPVKREGEQRLSQCVTIGSHEHNGAICQKVASLVPAKRPASEVAVELEVKGW